MPIDYSSILDDFLEVKDKLNVARLLTYLQTSQQLTDGEISNLKVTSNSKSQTDLLTLIRRKCPSAFIPFYESLAKSGQIELATFLFERVDKIEPNYLKPVSEYIQEKPSVKDKPILPANQNAILENEDFYKDLSDLNLPPVCGIIENLEVETVDFAPSLTSLDLNNIYRNFTKPKGLALVINNRKFDSGGMPERLGTDVDCKNISTLLSKLDYSVKIKNNLKAGEIIRAMEKFAQKEEHKIYDSAVVVLLSHGSHGAVYGSDNRVIAINDIVKQLNSDRCKALRDKPKIFIIQACRGERFDSGLDTADIFSTIQIAKTPLFDETDADPIKKVPLEADILIAYATTPGYVSWRNSVHGSWFIQGICEVFKENAKKEEILHLFTRVNRLVAERLSGCGHVQVPEPCSRLRKKFYFFPGVYF